MSDITEHPDPTARTTYTMTSTSPLVGEPWSGSRTVSVDVTGEVEQLRSTIESQASVISRLQEQNEALTARPGMRPTKFVWFADPTMLEGVPDPFNGRHETAAWRHAPSVEWRGGGRWVVIDGPDRSSMPSVWCETSGEWEYEPSPSNRDDGFMARTRYTLDEALQIARRLAVSDTDGGR